MGKPTISKYGVGAYVDGTDLIINDANILAEIGGNLESRTNIKNFNHYFTATYQFREQALVANNVYSVVGILNLPSAFKVLRAEFIGYADELGANQQFANNPVNSNSGNKVVGRLRHLDSTTGKALPFGVPGQSPEVDIEHTVTFDEGGKPEFLGTFASNGGGAEGPINLTVTPNSLLEVSFKKALNAQADFYPTIFCVVFCVMEHGK